MCFPFRYHSPRFHFPNNDPAISIATMDCQYSFLSLDETYEATMMLDTDLDWINARNLQCLCALEICRWVVVVLLVLISFRMSVKEGMILQRDRLCSSYPICGYWIFWSVPNVVYHPNVKVIGQIQDKMPAKMRWMYTCTQSYVFQTYNGQANALISFHFHQPNAYVVTFIHVAYLLLQMPKCLVFIFFF